MWTRAQLKEAIFSFTWVCGLGYLNARMKVTLKWWIFMLWKHPRYVEGREFYELFEYEKIFGARALPRARTPKIRPTGQKTAYFWLFSGDRICARAARGSARAAKIFLLSEKIIKNPSATFFFCQYLKNWRF